MERISSAIFRILLLTLIILSAASSQLGLADESPRAERSPEATGAFFAISVQDLDKAVRWYSEVLGFRLTSQGGNEQRKGALLEREGAVLELAEFKDAVPRDKLKSGLESHHVHGIFKIGFTTADLDATFAAVEKAGAEVFFPIVDASDGKRTFGIKDVEGNIIQFIGD
jgi:predicted enzyme related to lactoylglutathione lyase